MADHYVDSNVGGPGAGTIGDPWKLIEGNINTLNAGDTLHLRGGAVVPQIYAENEIDITADGADGSPITIQPYLAELVTIRAGPGDKVFHIVADWILVEGKGQLFLDKNSTWARAIRIQGDHNIINDTEIANVDGGAAAIVWIDGDHNRLDTCEIHDGFKSNDEDCSGVLIFGGSFNVVDGCSIYDCFGDCWGTDDDAAAGEGNELLNSSCWTTVGQCSENGVDCKWNQGADMIIQGNTFWGFVACTATCGGSGDLSAATIQIHRSCDDVVIAENTIFDCTNGIRLNNAPQNVIIRNNLIYDLNDSAQDPNATSFYAFTLHGTNIEVINNTVVDAPEVSLLLVNPMVNVTIYNNIFYNCGDITGEGLGGYTANWNCWFLCDETLAGGNDVNADPRFLDQLNDDYTLASNSPCIDAGTDVGLPYNGTAPDMGAFESGFASTTTTTATTVTSTVTATVTATSTLTATSTVTGTSTIPTTATSTVTGTSTQVTGTSTATSLSTTTATSLSTTTATSLSTTTATSLSTTTATSLSTTTATSLSTTTATSLSTTTATSLSSTTATSLSTTTATSLSTTTATSLSSTTATSLSTTTATSLSTTTATSLSTTTATSLSTTTVTAVTLPPAITATAVNACDVSVWLGDLIDFPTDVSGSSNEVSMNFDHEIGQYVAFGSAWPQRLECGKDAEFTLQALYSQTDSEASDLLIEWWSQASPDSRTLTIYIPEKNVGWDKFEASVRLSALAWTADRGEPGAILATAVLLPDGEVTHSDVAT